jgi:hypothetical protein
VENSLQRAGALAPGADLALYRTDGDAWAALQTLAATQTPLQG